MTLFIMNGEARSPIVGVPFANMSQRRGKSTPVFGLFSPSTGDIFDPNVDALPVIISGVEGSVTLNVDSVDFGALGLPGDLPWDGDALEASNNAIQKFMALTLVDQWIRLADGTAKAGLVAGTAEIGKVGMQQQVVVDVAIPTTPSLSAAIDLGVARPVALQVPAGWEGTSIAFDASHDGVTFAPLYTDAGVEKTITVAPSRYVILSPADFLGVRRVKVRPLTVQTAARTLRLITQP